MRDDAGRPRYFISQIQDIDERKQAQHELEHLANHDALTGALNRRAWDRELARAIAHAERDGRSLAVALIDLDHFKLLNDTHGHVAGDQALVAAARGWQAQLRGGDLLARIGGDEFAVLLPDCEREHVDAIVRRLKPSRAGAQACSIGVTVRRPGEDADALTRRADRALYGDKTSAAR